MIMTFEATDDGMLVLDTPPMMVFVPIFREHFPWANELRMLSWSSNLWTEPVGLLEMYWLLSLRILHASRMAANAPPTGTLRGSLARRVCRASDRCGGGWVSRIVNDGRQSRTGGG